MATREELEIIIKAQDQASSELKKLRDSLNTTKNATAKYSKEVDLLKTRMNRLAKIGAVALSAALIGIAKVAIDFESAFAGVRKTVDATEEQFAKIRGEFIAMSKEFPTAANELARIGELAGQLGIKTENITSFAKTIADLAVTTNLTSESAATDFARIINIMQESQDNVDKMGSTVVELGNNFATTESEIVNFATRIAGAGKIAGLTTSDIFGISTAFASVGVQAERGGTAVSKTLFSMANAVKNGGDILNQFAFVAGQTADEFKKSFEEDASNAFDNFVAGLGERGIEATGLLEELELGDQRLLQSFISVAGAGGIMTDAINVAGEAFNENTALTIEAAKRYETTSEQIKILKNRMIGMAIEIGDRVLPAINKMVKFLGEHEQAVANVVIALAGLITVFIGLKSVLIVIETIKGVTGALTLLKIAAGKGGAASAISKLVATMGPYLIVAAAAAIATKLLVDAYAGLQKDTDALNESIKGLSEMITKADEAMNNAADEETRNKYKLLGDEMRATKEEAEGLSKITFGNLVGGFTSNVKDFFGGGRQTGGAIDPGRSFTVGEGGPEVITPRVLSTVTPNNQTTNNNINLNIDVGSVRSNQDIDTIAQKIQDMLSRNGVLAIKGAF